jgi:lipopolysaccharide/colanic/teichoic acid biosynthesis glycosyltransferase
MAGRNPFSHYTLAEGRHGGNTHLWVHDAIRPAYLGTIYYSFLQFRPAANITSFLTQCNEHLTIFAEAGAIGRQSRESTVMRAQQLSYSHKHSNSLWLKRAVDIVGSVLGLILLLPLLVIVAIMIKLDSPGPAFFRQKRVGQGGRSFRILKFRTMCVGAEQLGPKLTVHADKRVTRVGRFLRGTKIDELPQLINVLAGSMSLVGPRPETPQYFMFYTPEQRSLILSMRPGMTDYASILLRDESSLFPPDRDPVEIYRHEILPVKIRCYQRYLREMGALSDLRIILATILLLVVRWSPGWLGVEHDLGLAPLRSMEPNALAPIPVVDRNLEPQRSAAQRVGG